MTSASEVGSAAQHWNDYARASSRGEFGQYWWQSGSAIPRHRNAKIGGNADQDWAEYALRKYFGNRLPLRRILSLGCGEGVLERTLADFAAFEQCDAYDVANESIDKARRQASEAGLCNIEYHVADINTLKLPAATYDAVWINAAMHHFAALEHISEQIRNSLAPGGLLILNEYVGPNRFQFPARQKEIANHCLMLLPARYRMLVPAAMGAMGMRTGRGRDAGWWMRRAVEKLRDGSLWSAVRRRVALSASAVGARAAVKTFVSFPTVLHVERLDPSEAIRSADILEVVGRDFKILEKKDWGGNIFQFLLDGIAGNFKDGDPGSQELLRAILSLEDALIAAGELQSDFTFLVAEARR